MENVELFFNDVFENSPIKLHLNNLIKPNIENSQALPCSTSLGISNIGLKKNELYHIRFNLFVFDHLPLCDMSFFFDVGSLSESTSDIRQQYFAPICPAAYILSGAAN